MVLTNFPAAESALYWSRKADMEKALMSKEQFDRLPELFKEIIKVTQEAEVACNSAIVELDSAKHLLQRKRQLIEAAAKQYGYTLKGGKLP